MIFRHVLVDQQNSISRTTNGKFSTRIQLFSRLVSRRLLTTQNPEKDGGINTKSSKNVSTPLNGVLALKSATYSSNWENNPNFAISQFSELPYSSFGINQHTLINDELKECLKQVLWQFRAPIRYAFAYGSGVFPQSNQTGISRYQKISHPNAPQAVIKAQAGIPKMIDFIFGVSYTQHWHSLNLTQHRDHYSILGSLGSGVVSMVQDEWGAGVYFNPYAKVNGIMIKYGVVNLDTLCKDLSGWKTLYLAGRLQKPVIILRDDPRVRLANQVNLISALRTALLLLPSEFTEHDLYSTIASISYTGDIRMNLPTEDPLKVTNIVGNNLPNFRRLYSSLLQDLPNVCFRDNKGSDSECYSDPHTNLWFSQDMDPVERGNMIRRLPKTFRSKIYFQYQKKHRIPQHELEKILEECKDDDSTSSKRESGNSFQSRIANQPPEILRNEIRDAIKSIVSWTSTSQTLKGLLTAGLTKTWTYMREKIGKNRQGKQITSPKR